jgi:hypothetical protein
MNVAQAVQAGLLAGAVAMACGCGSPRPEGGSEPAADGTPAATAAVPAPSGGAWEVLFDGTDLRHWRGYRREDVPAAWRIEDGSLALVPGGEGQGGDLVTRDTFGDFELELEWRVTPGANSGIFFRGTEAEPWIYQSAPEMQVLDNAGHADGRSPLTSAGSNFALHAVGADVTRPVGEWNQARVVARGSHVEHWLNRTKVVEYELWSPDWERRVAASKFAAWPPYGRASAGHVALQDHGNPVWFRNIRIRRL